MRATALIALVLVCGCTRVDPDARYPVSVVIRVDGKPVEHGVVMFYPLDGRGAVGGTFEKGTHRFDCPAGEARVEILKLALRPGIANKKAADGSALDPYVNELPAKFNTESDLRATVTAAGPNEFVFDLQTK